MDTCFNNAQTNNKRKNEESIETGTYIVSHFHKTRSKFWN